LPFPFGLAVPAIVVEYPGEIKMIKATEQSSGVCDRCQKPCYVLAHGQCMSCTKKEPRDGTFLVQPTAQIQFREHKIRSKVREQALPIYGAVFGAHMMTAFASTPGAEYHGLMVRSLGVCPIPDLKFWHDFDKFIFSQPVRELLFPNLPNEGVGLLTLDEFLSHGHFPKLAVQRYTAAYEFSRYNYPTKTIIDKHNVFKPFVKWEKIDKLDFEGPDDSAVPRMIHPATPLFGVSTCFIYGSAQRYLHHEWNDNIFFAAGKNLTQLSLWYQRARAQCTVAYVDDMTIMERSHSEYAHKFMIKLSKLLGMGRHKWPLHCRIAQVHSRGITRFGAEHSVLGTMKSGAADTCFSNSVLNNCLHFYALYKSNKMSVHELYYKLHMAFLGDDNLLLTREDVKFDKVEELMNKAGFIPKLVKMQHFDESIFLNTRPYPIESHSRILVVTNLCKDVVQLQHKLALPLVGIRLPINVWEARFKTRKMPKNCPWKTWYSKIYKDDAFWKQFQFVLTDFPLTPIEAIYYAFPCCGKTTFANNSPSDFLTLDTDDFRDKSLEKRQSELQSVELLSQAYVEARSLRGEIHVQFANRIGRVLMRCGFSADSQKQPMAYMHGVCRGYYKSTYHVPILRQFIQRMLDLTSSFDQGLEHSRENLRRAQFEGSLKSNLKFRECQATRDFVCRIYNITHDELEHTESFVSNIPSIPSALFDTVFERIIAIDRE
jgi:hypothetical protein